MEAFMVSVSFLMTLLLQGKITEITAVAVIATSYMLFLWDASTTTIALAFEQTPEAVSVVSFLLDTNLNFPAIPLSIGLLALIVFNAFREYTNKTPVSISKDEEAPNEEAMVEADEVVTLAVGSQIN
jgi:hypothetical protein